MFVVRYKMNTMEKMPMILGSLTILLALFTVAEGNGCEDQQIVEIGRRSILNCSFSEGFVGVLWYNSTNFEDDPPILVFQHSEKSGKGYASGEFDILPSGSLIINDVSIMHETVFLVSQIINFKDPVKWHSVKVITYVKPSATFAVIRECNGKQHCFLGSSNISSLLNCYVNNARPKIKLFWIDPFHEEDKNVTKEHSTDDNGLTFSSAATTEYLPSKKYFLSLLACSATDPLMLLREDMSLVLIQNEAKFVGNMETLQLYFEVGTVASLTCPSGSEVNAVLWQMSRSLEDDRQALAYRMSVLHVDVIISLSAAGVELQNDGDLMIRGIQPQHEGFFFCIVRSMRKESIRSYEVITQVTPSPSHPVVDECNHQQYCVIAVEHGDTLICRLLGIRPVTHLEWVPSDQRYQSMLQNQTLQVIPKGDTSDVYVTVRLSLTQYIDDQTTVVCRTKGLNSDIWDMNAIVDLRFLQEGLVVDDSPTKNRAILWVIIVSAVVLIIIAIIILTRASVKCRANRKMSTKSQNEDTEEMAPLKELERPIEDKQVNDKNTAANRETSTKSQKTLEEYIEETVPMNVHELPTAGKQVNDEVMSDEIVQFIKDLKSTYKSMCGKIYPIPYGSENPHNVDNVFVDVGIDLHRDGDEVDLGNVLSSSGNLRLTSYHDIFKPSVINSKRIVLTADPGHGKSTLFLKAAADWQTRSEESSPLNDVQVFILLQLRRVAEMTSIYQAIRELLLPKNKRGLYTNDKIEEILNSASSIVIILEGYDEIADSNLNSDISDIIKGEMFPEVRVIISTRPSCTPEGLDAKAVMLRLTGCDAESRGRYINKFVHGEEDKAKIRSILKLNPILEDLYRIPVIFVMFMHIAKKEQNIHVFQSITNFFETLLTGLYNHMWNKSSNHKRSQSVKQKIPYYTQLNEFCFLALCQTTHVWEKNSFFTQVGEHCYNDLISIGVLCEAETGANQYQENVRFYHEFFVEWFAAKYIEKDIRSLDSFLKTKPFADFQLFLRFCCGLNSKAVRKVNKYLHNDSDEANALSLFCTLEQNKTYAEFLKSVGELCSSSILLKSIDSKVLDSSTLQVLEIAANNYKPIASLILDKTFKSVDGSSSYIVLQSELCLPTLTTLKRLEVKGDKGSQLSMEDFLGVLEYCANCDSMTTLKFSDYIMPLRVTRDETLSKLQQKKETLTVQWQIFVPLNLDLITGRWKQYRSDKELRNSDLQNWIMCLNGSMTEEEFKMKWSKRNNRS